MNISPILFELREVGSSRIALITFNRPESLNSFTPEMHETLWVALDNAATSGARCAVLTGAGRGFCAGADLSSFDFSTGENLMERANPRGVLEKYYTRTALALAHLPMPTVCAVNGVAAGAGASFVMACDIAIAAPDASFVQAFSKIGLIPDAGGSWYLPQRLGMARAMALAMTGDKLSAAQAKEFGMIWDVQDNPLEETLKLAEKLSAMPTKALVETRSLLRAAHKRSLEEQLAAELESQSALGYTHDYIEGVSAFLQKRKPVFKGA